MSRVNLIFHLETANARPVPRMIHGCEADRNHSAMFGTGRAVAELETANARSVPRMIHGCEADKNHSIMFGTERAVAELE